MSNVLTFGFNHNPTSTTKYQTSYTVPSDSFAFVKDLAGDLEIDGVLQREALAQASVGSGGGHITNQTLLTRTGRTGPGYDWDVLVTATNIGKNAGDFLLVYASTTDDDLNIASFPNYMQYDALNAGADKYQPLIFEESFISAGNYPNGIHTPHVFFIDGTTMTSGNETAQFWLKLPPPRGTGNTTIRVEAQHGAAGDITVYAQAFYPKEMMPEYYRVPASSALDGTGYIVELFTAP